MTRPSVLITGGRRGIGRGIARAFAAADWNVVINDLTHDADTTATLDALGPQGAFIPADIADLATHAALTDAAWSAFGGIDALVNNAGVSVATRGDMLDIAPDSYDRLMDINLRGPFFLTQTIARRWLTEPPSRPRSIINIASFNTVAAAPDRAEYCLSKAGVGMMTQLFALRLADDGIGVFEIRPGLIRTPMTAVAAAQYDAVIAAGRSPIRRWGEPADIGGVAVALAGGAFHFSTGEVINVGGGLHIPRL